MMRKKAILVGFILILIVGIAIAFAPINTPAQNEKTLLVSGNGIEGQIEVNVPNNYNEMPTWELIQLFKDAREKQWQEEPSQ